MKHCVPILLVALVGCRRPLPHHSDVPHTPVRAAEVRPEPKPPDPPPPHVDPAPLPLPPPVDRGNPGPNSPPDPALILPEINSQLRDAFFDYDRSTIRPDGLAALEHDARILAPILADFPQLALMVEGHCDERGSAEYNIGLGDHRARRAAEVLQQFGMAPGRVQIVSYGKEAPQCREPNEACRQRNRRAHLVLRTIATTE